MRSPRPGNFSRVTSEAFRRPVEPSSPRSRTGSVDHALPGGAPFEDLRRRLATINGSTSSLKGRERRHSLASAQTGPGLMATAVSTLPDMPTPLERPGSPTESMASASNSSAFRGLQRLSIGAGDSQKAAPAVGSSKTNVTGLLEVASKMRSESSPERSGRSSPVSVAGTVRGQTRPRVPSLAPISTYGE
jgi:phosphoinositide-3-kinase regulatory subunit 4